MPKGPLTAMVFAIAAIVATPALSEPGRGKGNGFEQAARAVQHCPPGLAKKNPPCVPPGQARKADERYLPRVGEVLRIADYVLVRDPGQLNLETHTDWRYYRDGNRAYRVDSGTRKILAVIELVNAFTN